MSSNSNGSSWLPFKRQPAEKEASKPFAEKLPRQETITEKTEEELGQFPVVANENTVTDASGTSIENQAARSSAIGTSDSVSDDPESQEQKQRSINPEVWPYEDPNITKRPLKVLPRVWPTFTVALCILWFATLEHNYGGLLLGGLALPTIYSLFCIFRVLKFVKTNYQLPLSPAKTVSWIALPLFPLLAIYGLDAWYRPINGLSQSATEILQLQALFGIYLICCCVSLWWRFRWAYLVGKLIPLNKEDATRSTLPNNATAAWLYAILMNVDLPFYFTNWNPAIITVRVLAQAIGFHLMNLGLKERYVGMRASLVSTLKEGPSSSSKHLPGEGDKGAAEIVIKYEPFAEWQKWLSQRFSQRSKKKTIFVSTLAGLYFLLGGPYFTMKLLFALIPQAGEYATAADAAAGTTAVIGWLFAAFGGMAVAGLGCFLATPTHLRLRGSGLSFLWHQAPFFSITGKEMPWSKVARISLDRKAKTVSPLDSSVVFAASGLRNLKVKLRAIVSAEDRHRVLKAIEVFAPNAPREASVLQALEPPPDHSYTELWLQALSAPPKRERLKPLMPGAVLHDSRYSVIRSLGVGGQGAAYLATDKDNGAEIVLKEFILPVYVDIGVRKKSLESFENEARILKSLNHPQIVKLIDFFVEDHRCYLVLEHIDGMSLRELVEKQGKYDESTVKSLALQMCEILSYLHGLTPPVVHRDFTPDNLILRRDGTLTLVDFNVAQQTESTATGTVVGKHAYLPPEQFRGNPVTQSDIYGLGATLFYLLVGTDPEPISCSHPQRLLPSVSNQFDLIVAKATFLELEGRYKNAEELLSDLEIA
jgi:tRNA A-37 threonylcarbamoyl transferase component Bud32